VNGIGAGRETHYHPAWQEGSVALPVDEGSLQRKPHDLGEGRASHGACLEKALFLGERTEMRRGRKGG